MEPSYRKYLDFHIIFDHNQHWLVHCWFCRRIEKCGKFPTYPPSCTHYVSQIKYGVDLWVLFPKTGFPEKSGEVRLMNSTYLINNKIHFR